MSMLKDITNEPFAEMDTIDIASVVAIFLGAGVLSGFAVVQLAGYDLGATAYTFGEATDISYAISLILVGAGAAAFTNGIDRDSFDNMSDAEKISVGVLAGATVLFVFSPDVASWIEQTTLRQGVFTAVSTFAGVVLASE